MTSCGGVTDIRKPVFQILTLASPVCQQGSEYTEATSHERTGDAHRLRAPLVLNASLWGSMLKRVECCHYTTITNKTKRIFKTHSCWGAISCKINTFVIPVSMEIHVWALGHNMAEHILNVLLANQIAR